MPRFHCPLPLTSGDSIALPPNAARHVQVLRLQPGDGITLFGDPVAGGEWDATVRPRIPASLQMVYDRNINARRELRAMAEPRDTLPAWRIIAPAPAEELLGYYRDAEAATGPRHAWVRKNDQSSTGTVPVSHGARSTLPSTRGRTREPPQRWRPYRWEIGRAHV